MREHLYRAFKNRSFQMVAIFILGILVGGLFLKGFMSRLEQQVVDVSLETKIVKEISPISDVPEVATNSNELVNIVTNKIFTLAASPNVGFRITRVARAYGDSMEELCKVTGSEDGSSCVHYITVYQKEVADPALLIIEYQVDNKSEKKVLGNFFQVLYEPIPGEISIAPYYIHSAIEVGPLTKPSGVMSFIVPSTLKDASIVYGYFPPIIYQGAEDLLSRSEGGFILNFQAKTLNVIPG